MAEKKRVAVISKDADLAAFFELEAVYCGCSVTVLSVPPTDLTPYDVAIADAAAGYCLADGAECRVVTLLTADHVGEIPMSETVWHWPVAIGEIRALLEDTGAGQTPCGERTNRGTSEPTVYVLSEEKREVLYRNRTVELTAHEWRILQCLGERAGETVEREKLNERIGGGEGNAVDVYIHLLRKKLETPFGIKLISAIRGKGYRLEAHLKQIEK